MGQPVLLDAALGYARRRPAGVSLLADPADAATAHRLPVRMRAARLRNPGKHPIGMLVPNGLSNASTDETRLRHWWTARPDANIAIATGAVVVLDVDPRHRGDASLAELERKHGALPTTARVRTGGGGLHVYLQPPPGVTIRNSASKLAPGLDIRGSRRLRARAAQPARVRRSLRMDSGRSQLCADASVDGRRAAGADLQAGGSAGCLAYLGSRGRCRGRAQ